MRELRTQERRPVRSGACWAGWRPYTGYHPPPATLFQSKNERRPQQEGRRSERGTTSLQTLRFRTPLGGASRRDDLR
jgi:hypothetical protein